MHAYACRLLSSSHRCCGVRETIQRLATGGWSRNAVWDRLPSSLWSSEALPSIRTDRTPGIEPAVLGIEPSGSNLGLELAARAGGVMVRGGCWVGRLSRVLRG